MPFLWQPPSSSERELVGSRKWNRVQRALEDAGGGEVGGGCGDGKGPGMGAELWVKLQKIVGDHQVKGCGRKWEGET